MSNIEPKSTSPIFIVGTERSGSNLLRLILTSHSHIFIPHPPHLLNYFGHLDYGELQNDPPNKNTKKLLRDMCRLIDNHIFPWDEYNLQVDALEQNIVYPSHFGLMATIYENALRQSSPRKTRWGCKSTFMIHYIEDVMKVYDNPKFIWLIRDPRDVSASAKKSVFSPCHPFLSAQLWVEQQTFGLKMEEKFGSSNIHRCHYENLLRDSESEIQNICDFIGEDFEDGMLSFFQSKEAQKSAHLSKSWEKTGQPIQKNNSNKYRKLLDAGEIADIECLCHPLMKELGYEPDYPNQPSSPTSNTQKWFQIKEKQMRWGVEWKSFREDKNHFLRWKRDLIATYFSIRHRHK